MTDIALAGLDGANPLAFMASLGLLRVLDARTASGTPRPTLHWRDEGRWRPVLGAAWTLDEVIEQAWQEIQSLRDEPALALRVEGHEDETDLKPPPARYRAFLRQAADLVAANHTRTSRFAAALATELVTDNQGNTKPTAFHFTAGQQRFLTMVNQLVSSVTREHLREALSGPWRGDSPLPSLSWDSTMARNYALRASDPSKEKRGSVPGAELLAFLGLPLFPIAANARLELVTACVRGGWKDASFTWPLWTPRATVTAIRSLLVEDYGRRASFGEPRERAARGVVAVFRSNILRSDQGGYGSFTPARPL